MPASPADRGGPADPMDLKQRTLADRQLHFGVDGDNAKLFERGLRRSNHIDNYTA